MPVWFVYRSFDVAPTGKHLRRFDDDTVLGWFQRNWAYLAVADQEEADRRLEEVVGCDGWFLWNPFHAAAVNGVPMPRTDAELLELLRGYVEEMAGDSAHGFAIFTEEDGEGGALYYLDGHFLAQHGPRAAYLLQEDWRLPSGCGAGGFVPSEGTENFEPSGDGPGATYAVILERGSKYPLDDLGPAYRIDGVRLPSLAHWLLTSATTKELPYVHRLPALMVAGVSLPDPMEDAFLSAIRANPSDAASWAAWADWREERGLEPPGISLLRSGFARLARLPGRLQDGLHLDDDLAKACRELLEAEEKHRAELRTSPKSLIHVEGHLAQMCLDGSHTDSPYFGQWILFDDLWASAHPELADALLTWCARWDVLSEGGRH
jgi:uncharacterized protein (TIGR02996 family)